MASEQPDIAAPSPTPDTPLPEPEALQESDLPLVVQEPQAPGVDDFLSVSLVCEPTPEGALLPLEEAHILSLIPDAEQDHELAAGVLEAVITVRSVPKLGTSKHDCEDATYPDISRLAPVDQQGLNIGIADGATSYSYSRRWAELALEHLHGVTDLAELLGAPLSVAQEQWSAWVREQTQSAPQSWFSARKLKEGSHCTLVNLRLLTRRSVDLGRVQWKYTWEAAAVGDSCLIHLDALGNPAAQTGTPFPLNSPDQYSSVAYLLPSLPDQVAGVRTHVPEPLTMREFGEDEAFLLMTDALAVWFLTAQQAWVDDATNQRPIEVLETFLYHPEKESESAPERPAEVNLSELGVEEAASSTMLVAARPEHPFEAASSDPPEAEDAPAFSSESAVPADQETQRQLAFATWADTLRQAPGSALKDDDLSFIHVRFRRRAQEG
ncbi:hypothetical protein [Deinococcus hopiensis]|uniref:Protein phosphatase 2C n=1 Tax=Deinococcus hopiensis KR-140 TaxID=695939 RepID=A0A1W1UM60_9DEIO|nr:hypothetical protein [Deinococcus hopiensis]SMB82150.1 hypothetical protein SAMN00790413_04864 [Deinococcus hopiensis KR-140]